MASKHGAPSASPEFWKPFQSKCLKGMLVIYCPVRNFQQYSRLGQIDTPPISLGVKRRRWRWIGHVYRMPLASVPRVAMNRTRDIKRARGQTRRDTREITGLGDSRARGGKTLRDLEDIEGHRSGYMENIIWTLTIRET